MIFISTYKENCILVVQTKLNQNTYVCSDNICILSTETDIQDEISFKKHGAECTSEPADIFLTPEKAQSRVKTSAEKTALLTPGRGERPASVEDASPEGSRSLADHVSCASRATGRSTPLEMRPTTRWTSREAK